MATFYRSLIGCLLLFLFFTSSARATHVAGAELSYYSDTTAARNPLRYFFKLVTYTDKNSVADNPTATLYLGDGVELTSDRTMKILNGTCNSIFANTFFFEYTFPGPGIYNVAYLEVNRTRSTNLTEADLQPFVISATLQIDLFDTQANWQRFLSSPISCAIINQPFRSNLAISNFNDDSLTYELITPLTARSVNNAGLSLMNVMGYQLPAQVQINARTGEFSWLNPTQLGTYTFAVRVNRYRQNNLIGSATRDFIITVSLPDNLTQSFTIENRQELSITNQNQITFTPGQPLVIKVKYQTSDTAKSLVAYTDLFYQTPLYTLDAASSTNTITAEFKIAPAEAWRRQQPYLLVFRGLTIQNNTYALQDFTLTLVAKPGTISSNPDQPGEPAGTPEKSFVIYPNPAKYNWNKCGLIRIV